MNLLMFRELNLKTGDLIWIVIETGEGFFGRYRGQVGANVDQFLFYNNSNGREEIREISKLQRIQRQ